jgi:ribosomal protein L34E
MGDKIEGERQKMFSKTHASRTKRVQAGKTVFTFNKYLVSHLRCCMCREFSTDILLLENKKVSREATTSPHVQRQRGADLSVAPPIG